MKEEIDRRKKVCAMTKFYIESFAINQESGFEEIIWVADQLRQSNPRSFKLEHAVYLVIHEIYGDPLTHWIG